MCIRLCNAVYYYIILQFQMEKNQLFKQSFGKTNFFRKSDKFSVLVILFSQKVFQHVGSRTVIYLHEQQVLSVAANSHFFLQISVNSDTWMPT